jgi:hypothetical protein
VAPPDNIVAPQGRAEMERYLSQRAAPKGPLAQLEQAEQAFLTRVTGLFDQTKQVQPQVATVQQTQPTPQSQVVTQPQQAKQQEQGKGIKIPDAAPIRVITEERGIQQKEEHKIPEKPEPQLTRVDPSVAQPKSEDQAQQAQFSVDASPPMPPSQPNTISGQVMDAEGKIVEAAILEITDVSGRPVRAVKTNKLGHFYVVTPLQDGTYEIEIEKEALEFDKVKFEATGSIIPPIAIRAKNKLAPNGEG